MPKFRPLPSPQRLHELLRYESQTGKMYWKQAVARWITPGDEAGTYVRCAVDVTIDTVTYRAHRIIWFLMTGQDPGPFLIDHIDGNPHNNKLENLRAASSHQNQCNQKKRKDNTSGLKGVTWDKNRDKWAAAIHVNKKRIALGRYDSKEKAYAAYCEAACRLHGDFARLE